MAAAPTKVVVPCPIETCSEHIAVEIELKLDALGPRPAGTRRDLSIHVKGPTDTAMEHFRRVHPEVLVWI